MQGTIEEIRRECDGRVTVIISTISGQKKLYGLPNPDVAPGSVVEYATKTSQSGYPYAKFLRYVSIVPCFGEQAPAEECDTGIAEQSVYAVAERVQEYAEKLMEHSVDGHTEDGYMTVSELNRIIKSRLSVTPEFRDFWVKGEVTNYSGHSKHYFFSIKDEGSLISCVLWESLAAGALDFVLEKGQKIAVKGSLDYSEKSEKLNIIVSKIINIGEGDAKLKYEQLRQKLLQEGIFDTDHHKEIPRHAQRVGIVTSKDGQAIRDICKVAKERNPYVQLILFHVKVQGVMAVKTTIEGIRRLDEEGVDVIIVGRGGGSDEELLVYDDESLVRAVYEARTPIVSAVGHAGHKPLVDDVADEKFATPTDAAQHVISDVMSEIRRVEELKRQFEQKAEYSLRQRSMRLAKLQAELEKNSPEVRLREKLNRLESLKQQLGDRMNRVFQEKKLRCEVLTAKLNGLSPTAKLVRGFGYISVNGRPVTAVDEVTVDDMISVRIHDGEIEACVTGVKKEALEIRK